jgi:hypothetical protein
MTRERLPLVLAALLVFQVLHGVAPAPDGASDEGGLTGLIGGVLFLVATGVAWWWVHRGDERGVRLAQMIGIAIPVGFTLYHGVWFNSPVTNPYWGDGSASGWQWASLPLVMVTGLLAAALASRRETPAAMATA